MGRMARMEMGRRARRRSLDEPGEKSRYAWASNAGTGNSTAHDQTDMQSAFNNEMNHSFHD